MPSYAAEQELLTAPSDEDLENFLFPKEDGEEKPAPVAKTTKLESATKAEMPAAPAASAATDTLITDPIFNSLPPDIQDEILQETNKAHYGCTIRTVYSMFNNCDCVASKFFEARLNNPEESYEALLMTTNKECVNQPGVAGYSYNKCINLMVYFSGDLENYCTCYANKMAKMYANRPIADYGYLRNLGVRAFQECVRESKIVR